MWSAIRPGSILMIEDVHGINRLLKWILEGHKVEGQIEGVDKVGGKVGCAILVEK